MKTATRAELVEKYNSIGIIPFLYRGPTNPGAGWPQSPANPDPASFIDTTTPIGIITGKRSNLAVVDIDVQNGGSLEALQKRYGDTFGTDTFAVSTPSGGLHLYYQYPDGIEKLTKAVNRFDRIEEFRGIDLLGDGHHVVAPPSARAGVEGKRDGAYTVMRFGEIAPLPDALLADWQAITERTPPRPPSGPVRADGDYYRDVHRAAVEEAADAPTGSRDDTAFRCVCRSVRVHLAAPDAVTLDNIHTDYGDVSFPDGNVIRDVAGKVDRALAAVDGNPWVPGVSEADHELPPNVTPDEAADFVRLLNNELLKDKVKKEVTRRRDAEAAQDIEMGEFMNGSDYFTQPIEESAWIIEDLWPSNGKVLLSASAKTGKTTMMVTLIESLTAGTAFLGEFKVPHPYTVAIIDTEMSHAQYRSWLERNPGINRDNLRVRHALGVARTVDVTNDAIRHRLAVQLRESGAEILIVDPLSPILSVLGIEESSPSEVRRLLDHFDVLAEEAGLVGVFISHHTGHGEKDRPRGGSPFMDWPTSLWNMQKRTNGDRTFQAEGRDVSLESTILAFDPITHRYSRSKVLDPFGGVDPWIVERWGTEVTLQDAMTGMGCSEPTARNRLQADGWETTGENKGGRGNASLWVRKR